MGTVTIWDDRGKGKVRPAAWEIFMNHKAQTVWDMLTDIFQETGETFIFVMDEWDAVLS